MWQAVGMGFRKVLLVGLAMVLFITVVTGTVSIVALHSATARYERLGHELADDLLGIEQLRAQAEELAAARRDHARTDDPAAHARVTEATAKLHELLAALHQRNLDPTSERELERIDQAAKVFVDAATADIENVDRLMQSFNGFEQAVTDFVDHQANLFDADLERARVASSRHELAVLLTTVLGLITSITLAGLVMRRLSQQWREAQTATAAAKRESAARQELLAVVSHDLRSPLSAVSMGAELLAETMPPSRHVQAIKNGADRMTSLIEDVLDAARLENGTITLHRSRWDAGGLLERAAELFHERAAKAGIALRVELPPAPLEGTGDAERVIQVVTNLLSNAMKFTPKGGEVVASVAAVPQGIEICVRDTGPGIPVEDQQRLFQRYWQGEASVRRGSLGLGLYICKNLIEGHGGKIWVESVPGSGSRFCFTLPTGRALESRA
jgi:signal transduction histidine kinase